MRDGYRAAIVAAPLLMLLGTQPQPVITAALQPNAECAAQPMRISLAEETGSIPGYHDCQRLLTRDLRYGPLVGIWARDYIDGFTVAEFSRGFMSTAVIYNFSAEAYPELGIGPGLNCLYMRRQGVAWHAFMVQIGSARVCPNDPVPPAYKRTPLSVKVQPNTRGEAPGAARWEMDANHAQYIGIACPDGWCEVGAPGFAPSFIYPGRKEVRVKGWYDEQHLSVVDVATGELRPSSIRGRVIPAASLEKVSDKDFRDWTRVATIIIEKDSAEYFGKRFHIRAGGSVHVSLRNSAGSWEARLEQEDRAVPRTVVRVEHAELRVPGTARWRFTRGGEEIWVRCGRASCTVI